MTSTFIQDKRVELKHQCVAAHKPNVCNVKAAIYKSGIIHQQQRKNKGGRKRMEAIFPQARKSTGVGKR